MNLIRLDILGISTSQVQSGTYVLILGEQDGLRRLPMVIGGFEAQSIAIALEDNLSPPRPLTHDLFENFARRFDITIKQVIIHKLVEGIFYSSLICERDGVEELIDARNSDAIALAIRFDAPVYTYDKILIEAGIILEKEIDTTQKDFIHKHLDIDTKIQNREKTLNHLSTKELTQILEKAVQSEHYEKAAEIRDELVKRNKSNH